MGMERKAAVVVAIMLAASAPAVAAGTTCSLSAITIKSLKAGFVDPCKRKQCPQMKGVAVLTNYCSEAVGVQLKLVALDKSGAPVAAKDFWPASIDNIPPGDYTFSLDYVIEYDRNIKSFTLQPIRVERWRAR